MTQSESLGTYKMASGFGGTFGMATAVDGSHTSRLATSNSTASAASNSLKFAAAKSIRTSTIILASFNAVAALATALGIIYGCYTCRKRNSRRQQHSTPSGLFFIPTVEVFPLVLSVGITIQSIMFAAAQSVGLHDLFSRGCTLVATFMLPGVFIVPYIHLVFGVETAIRALRSRPFKSRRRWDVGISIGIVCMFLLVNFLVADFIRTPDFCFASLFWFLKLYAPGCFALFFGISIVLLAAIGIIFFRLCRNSDIDSNERLAASRMVYYLSLGVISNAFIIPFFFSLTFLDQKEGVLETLNLSMVAAVVANLSGLMVAGLHLFLRSHTMSAIGPRDRFDDYDREQLKGQIRFRSNSSASDSSEHSLHTVSGPAGRVRSGSTVTLLHNIGSPTYTSPNPLRSNAVRPTVSIPKTPEPTQPPSVTSPSQMRKQQAQAQAQVYTLFPNDAADTTASTQSVALLPATTYSPQATKPSRDTFKPPPTVKSLFGRGHRRDSSIISSATVQIGLRLSSVDDLPPTLPAAKLDDQKEKPKPELATRPSPLAQIESVSAMSVSQEAQDISDETPKRGGKDARMKTLPPVPNPINGGRAKPQEEPDSLITLSPSVYSPQQSPSKAKLPSPKGVGFSVPPHRGNDRSPTRAPPRPAGSAAVSPMPRAKAEWI